VAVHDGVSKADDATFSGGAATYGFGYPQGGFIPVQHLHQQAHFQVVSNPAMILPQYQQPHAADDDGGDGGSSLVPISGGCIVPAVAHMPVAYPPLPQYQQPMSSSPPGLLRPQHANIALSSHHPWQHQQHQHLIMTAAPPLGVPPGYVLTQAPSAAHHQHPMMMPPGVFPGGYVQLQPLVHQQHQLIMGPVNSIPIGFVPEQQQQPTHPPILFNGVLHHPGDWVPVDNMGQPQPHPIPPQAYMHPPPYQPMGMYYPFPVQEDDAFDAADAASAHTSPTTHGRASRQQQMQQQQQQRAIQYSYSIAAQSPNSHPRSSPPNSSPIQRRSPKSSNFEGNPNRKKNKISTLVHQPIKSPQKKTAGGAPDREI